MQDQSQMPGGPGDRKSSRAFFAALLQANRSSCDCKACKILRKMGEDMTGEFLEGE